MDKGSTKYSLKTKRRELVFLAYFEGQIDRDTAIIQLNVSGRQFCRLQNKYLADKNLRHKLCNRASNHSISPETKTIVLELCKTKYRGWNYEHIHDSLQWRNEINISSDTIRIWWNATHFPDTSLSTLIPLQYFFSQFF